MATHSDHTEGGDNEISEYLKLKLHENRFYKEICEHLKTLTSHEDKIREKENAERWLRWASHKQHLKVISADVPTGVLPNGLEGEVIDVKVFTRRGPDDPIFDSNKDIRKKVARGNSFLRILKGPESGTTCVLQAMKKFTGGLGDDDDRDEGDNMAWRKYFTKPIEESDIAIATKKANGEAAHLSCRVIDDEYVMCGGSKNVHMMFRCKDDIKKYGEPRFRIAREVCETVIDALHQMGPENKQRLLQFMAWSRYTAVFEILSPVHQHVEDLSHSQTRLTLREDSISLRIFYHKQKYGMNLITADIPHIYPELKFITWTKCDLDPADDDCLGAVPPHIGIEIAKALGLTPVTYDVIPTTELNNRMKQIRQGYQYEGEVLYFLDREGKVIGLLKKKTVWYIMCRAIREKLRAACISKDKRADTFSLTQVMKKTEKRMTEIQEWLSLHEDTTREWKELAEKFLIWTLQKFESGEFTWDNIIDKYPVTWKTFLKENNETDAISVKCIDDGS